MSRHRERLLAGGGRLLQLGRRRELKLSRYSPDDIAHGRIAGQEATAELPSTACVALRAMSAMCAARKNAPKGCDKPLEFDRLGIERIAPRSEGLFPLPG
jgi:hypothetical protein